VITCSSTHVRGLLAADIGDIALVVIFGVCVLVMLVPFAGIAVVVRDAVREQRAMRRRLGADAASHRGQR
jgi:hypothetical protein